MVAGSKLTFPNPSPRPTRVSSGLVVWNGREVPAIRGSWSRHSAHIFRVREVLDPIMEEKPRVDLSTRLFDRFLPPC